ncbi:MAG: SIR2 family protein, partial [Clostridia bacterium]|nr:SIR2 family protein [Clostridia bacterium]
MELSEALQYALQGDAILFLGAGASADVLNQDGNEMPIGRVLANRLCENCDDLQTAVECFIANEEEKGNDGKALLIDFLIHQFSSAGDSDFHKCLAKIPWYRIYTTNYDDILERSYSNSSYRINSITPSRPPSACNASQSITYVHINGSINNLTKDTLDNEFKLTDSSYAMESFQSTEWGVRFDQDIQSASAVIFVGFSMSYDLDIKRIVRATNSNKCFYVLRKEDKGK